MKLLNLTIDLVTSQELTAEEKKQSPRDIAITVIKNVVLTYGLQVKGLGEDERRVYYKICDVFDKAQQDQVDIVELEDSFAEFIKKVFKESKLMPTDVLKQIENNIKDMKDKEKK
jgi:hypothetical protein